MANVYTGRGYVYSIQYHIVWCVKYRHKIIVGEIESSPQQYILDMIKVLKAVYARLLMKEYGDDLKKRLWYGHLWDPSYFIATVSENTEKQIANYIKN